MDGKGLEGLAAALTQHAELTASLFEMVESLEAKVKELEIKQQSEVREINDALLFFCLHVLTDFYPHLKEVLAERLELLKDGNMPDYISRPAIVVGCDLLIKNLCSEDQPLRPDWFRGVVQGKRVEKEDNEPD